MNAHSLKIAMLLLAFTHLPDVKAQTATEAAIQSQINSSCSTGGAVTLPSTVIFTSTLNLKCSPGELPVRLQGAPTMITCQTGATPCIVMGSTDPGNASRNNLSLKDVYLFGPGLNVVGSEGIRLLPSADLSTITDLRIDGFESGMHFLGDPALLYGVYISNLKVGVPTASTMTAVHLDGQVANTKFVNFFLSAQKRVILGDGPGGNGAGASFDTGALNIALTPGIAGVSVSTSDHSIRQLMLNNIEDWETACPYLEIGDGGSVTLTGVGWSGNPLAATTNPAIHILPNSVAWLKAANVTLNPCSTNGDLLRVESSTAWVSFANSDLYLGKLNFVAPAEASFVGNRCISTNGPALIGNLANVRASGNLRQCTDR